MSRGTRINVPKYCFLQKVPKIPKLDVPFGDDGKRRNYYLVFIVEPPTELGTAQILQLYDP